MSKHFDVLVVGLGANGSSATYHLAKSGARVCGIDRFRPPHQRGSSHGQSRIIRQAYFENPLYVPLVKAAYPIWKDMEEASGRSLFLKTGGIMLGQQGTALIRGSMLSAQTHQIPYQYLDKRGIAEKFPGLKPTDGTVGVLENDAGILFPEACIESFLEEARKNGAALQYNEQVLGIIPSAASVEVKTDKGVYTADKLILSAGAWTAELLPELKLPLVVERQVMFWFRNRNKKSSGYFSPRHFPVFLWEYSPGKMLYGFPDLGDGLKIAHHHSGGWIQPDDLSNDVSAGEISDMTAIVAKYFNMDAVFNYSSVCMYTCTPDQDFIIDVHPWHSNICIASPCSGHGFKFSSLTGKILSDMALGNPVGFDLSAFRISRFDR